MELSPGSQVSDGRIQGKVLVQQGEIAQVNQEAMRHLASLLPNGDPGSAINGGVPEALNAAITNKYYSYGNPDGTELALEDLTNTINERREYAAKKGGPEFSPVDRKAVEDAIHQGYADATRRRNTPDAVRMI